MNLVLEAGAEDMQSYETHYEIFTPPHGLPPVVDALEKAKITMVENEVCYLPNTPTPASENEQKSLDKLVEALEALDRDVRGHPARHGAVLLEPVDEAAPLDELHHDVAELAVLTDVVDPHDVLVLEEGHGLSLGLEPGLEAGLRRVLGEEDLDGPPDLEALVKGPIDAGHPAFAEGAGEEVAAVVDGGQRRHAARVGLEQRGRPVLRCHGPRRKPPPLGARRGGPSSGSGSWD